MPTYIGVIDYSKASDCIRWQNLWTILNEKRTSPPIIPNKNIYDMKTAYVRVKRELTIQNK